MNLRSTLPISKERLISRKFISEHRRQFEDSGNGFTQARWLMGGRMLNKADKEL